ncbi:hypothetical protein ASG31_07140 [Chryseobacterium sp. Leaf404]|uniref:class I SAM-dependent DNA methyltransferase n=1 Tax=unclassified Chryseobacterium TaxID=2593645 RepID=UPI0006FEAC68|nr:MULTISPECIES: SAM-dependent methyltransferase [unclassified Chryseobacterium]KQT18488.1 hypothetical protein ASG31_07140 [Chryseobacterium sp. Leaf404]
MNRKKSLETQYFDDVYAAKDDPWDFETSEYETAKYAATMEALPKKHYTKTLEIGCSIGVLSLLLAEITKNLLATDVSQKALDIAKKRCENKSNVKFECMSFPHEMPEGGFDLIMISEVAYYLSAVDWDSAVESVYKKLLPEGNIVLVHWLPEVHDYPQTGDEVHDSFERSMSGKLSNVFSKREENYRIDVWAKS